MNQNERPQQGAAVNKDPKSETLAKGQKPAQAQPWPGSARRMRPHADHGEESYVGANKLAGMKALITGGDSGIGRAVAIAFAREGADVAIAYYNEHDDAQDTVRWIERAGRKALAISGDLTNPAHCREVVRQAAEALGGVDILVNNAAYQQETDDIAEITPEQLERTFRTNVFSYFWMAQAALEHMGNGASIINTGSVNGLRGNDRLLDYAATKGAVHNFTHSLARQVAPRGIRVNCVAPGPVWTPLIVSTMGDDKIQSFGDESIWERPAQPAEIAPSYVFLASADARYYTGEILAPTGSDTTR